MKIQWAPFAKVLLKKHPNLTLEVLAKTDYLNLARNEADIALRTREPVDAGQISPSLFATESAGGIEIENSGESEIKFLYRLSQAYDRFAEGKTCHGCSSRGICLYEETT